MEHLSIGTKIKSNGLLSPVAYGEIIGVEMGYAYFMRNMHIAEFLLKEWNKVDPEWLHKPVYSVKKYLRDLPFYTDDERIPVEAREHVKQQWDNNPNLVLRRFIAFLPAEIEVLPDDYDWIADIEQSVNEDKPEDHGGLI